MAEMNFGGRERFGPDDEPRGPDDGSSGSWQLLRAPSEIAKSLPNLKAVGVGAELPLALCEAALGEMYNLQIERAEERLRELYHCHEIGARSLSESAPMEAARIWGAALRAQLELIKGSSIEAVEANYSRLLGINLGSPDLFENQQLFGERELSLELQTPYAFARYHTCCLVFLQANDLGEVRELGVQVGRLRDRAAGPLERALLALSLSDVARTLEKEDDARKLAVEAQWLLDEAGAHRLLPEALIHQALATLKAGDLERTDEAVRRVELLTNDAGRDTYGQEQRLYWIEGRLVGALALAARGDRPAAAIRLAAVRAYCSEFGFGHMLRPTFLPKLQADLTP